MRYRWSTLLWLVVAALVAGCGGRSATLTPVPVPTSDDKARQLKTFETLWQAVDADLVYPDFGGVDWDAVGQSYRARVEAGLTPEEFSSAMSDMLNELPAGLARYESRAARIEADTADASNYQGIGAFVAFRPEPDPHVVLLSVMQGSPAEAAGLKDHDSLYAVEGDAITLDEGLKVVNRIRGPADTSVTLTVQSPGGNRRDVIVKRGQITAENTPLAGTLTGTGLGYLRVPPVAGEQLTQVFVQALGTWSQSSPINGLIIDLRVAGSGGSWPLGELLAMFGSGEIGEFYSREGVQPQEITGQDVFGSQDLPLAILVGPDTQGLPEIFAAALQSMGRATVIGLTTPGEIELPTEYPLPDGSRAFVATSSFRTTDGRELGQTGVAPDTVVQADWDQVSENDDPVISAAIELLTR